MMHGQKNIKLYYFTSSMYMVGVPASHKYKSIR